MSQRRLARAVLLFAALAVLILAVGSRALAQSNTVRNATNSRRWKGSIGITTSGDGLWTFVTVAAHKEGEPLRAAFVLQHLPPVPPSINLTAKGTVELLSRPEELPGVALWVTTKEGGCSFFKLGDYSGYAPPRCQIVNLAGIARYDRTPIQNALPSGHNEFVGQVLPTLEKEGPHLSPGGQALDDCTSCPSGGSGSTGCTSSPELAGAAPGLDCSVTCQGGYYACCNLTCVCCKPTLSPSGSQLDSQADSLTRAARRLADGTRLPTCAGRSASRAVGGGGHP